MTSTRFPIATSIFLVATLTGAAAAQTWTLLTPAPYPNLSARRSGGAVFDPIQNKVLIYGGLQSGPTAALDDTWAFDGGTWTQVTPATTTPPLRWGHRMVLDSRRMVVVTFGGRSPTITATANDTWEWDGNDWHQVFPAASPNPRAFYSMVYDERRGRCVLFGVQSGSSLSGGNQTWEYDGSTWTQASTATTPPGLETPAMAYDKGRGVTVMFGGWNGTSPGTMYDTTYEFDGVDWTLRTIANPPPARYRAGCVYDDARGRVVLYGGYGSGGLQDTWEYDGNDWTQVLAAGGPPKMTEGYMAYSDALESTIYFGGSGPSGGNNETWLYTGPTDAIAAPFGSSCPTGVGTTTLTPTTTPVLGSNYVLDIANGPAATSAFMTHGFSNLSWQLGSLPADLSPFGIGGCQLEVRPEATTLILVTGTGTQTLTFPVVASLIGQAIYSQAVVLDATAPNGICGMTNAVHAVLGT
ncbi:MAG: hypothetical protein KDC98_21745 [Planctomycetes bacterium]|nr:hypothetical protein [Planctomycetota bacterium]